MKPYDTHATVDPFARSISSFETLMGTVSGGDASAWTHAELEEHFKAAGIGAVPAAATSVVLNLTAVNPTSNGFLYAWGDGSGQGSTPALNFTRAAPATPVLLYLPVSHGHVDLFNPFGTLDAVADVEVYTTN